MDWQEFKRLFLQALQDIQNFIKKIVHSFSIRQKSSSVAAEQTINIDKLLESETEINEQFIELKKFVFENKLQNGDKATNDLRIKCYSMAEELYNELKELGENAVALLESKVVYDTPSDQEEGENQEEVERIYKTVNQKIEVIFKIQDSLIASLIDPKLKPHLDILKKIPQLYKSDDLKQQERWGSLLSLQILDLLEKKAMCNSEAEWLQKLCSAAKGCSKMWAYNSTNNFDVILAVATQLEAVLLLYSDQPSAKEVNIEPYTSFNDFLMEIRNNIEIMENTIKNRKIHPVRERADGFVDVVDERINPAEDSSENKPLLFNDIVQATIPASILQPKKTYVVKLDGSIKPVTSREPRASLKARLRGMFKDRT